MARLRHFFFAPIEPLLHQLRFACLLHAAASVGDAVGLLFETAAFGDELVRLGFAIILGETAGPLQTQAFFGAGEIGVLHFLAQGKQPDFSSHGRGRREIGARPLFIVVNEGFITPRSPCSALCFITMSPFGAWMIEVMQ